MRNRLVLLFMLFGLSLSAVASIDGRTALSTKLIAAPTPEPSPAREPPVLKKSDVVPGKPQPAPTPQPDEPEEIGEEGTVRVSTQLVTVPVSIMDREGRYVTDLKREEFRIYEDGTEQEAAFFASTDKSFTVVLMLDVSDSAILRIDEVKAEAILFTEQLREGDRAIVVEFDRQMRVLAEATSDKEILRQAIESADTGQGTSLYNAVDMTLKQVLRSSEGRKAIVLFTDGVDTSSMGASFQSNLRDASESDALIYTVQYPLSHSDVRYDVHLNNKGTAIGGSQIGVVGRVQRLTANKYLLMLPEKTGGRQFMADSSASLRKAFAAVADELRHQYTLGYYPKTPTQPGQHRRIKVRVTRPNLVVRARNSYGLGSGENIAPTDRQK